MYCRFLSNKDDIIFERFSPHLLEQCIDFLSTNKEWNVFFLGCLVKGSKKTYYPSISKIQYRCSAHAYVVNRHFAETIVKKEWDGTAFDDLLARFKEGMYMIRPAFAFQSDSPTDNEACLNLDKIRRLCGGIREIQKMNEFYHYHKPLIIALHLFVIGIIIGLIV